jgi:hypothetical protein
VTREQIAEAIRDAALIWKTADTIGVAGADAVLALFREGRG